MAVAKSWIVLTDTDKNGVRINVAQICYYRAAEEGSNVCMGGTSDRRLVISVTETCEQIDALIGGDFNKATYGMLNI